MQYICIVKPYYIVYVMFMKARTISPNAAEAVARLGRDIQTARKKRRLRQKDLAVRMGVSVASLQRLEKGDPGVSIGILAMAFLSLGCLNRFSDALDVASDDIGLLHDQAALPKRIRRQDARRKREESGPQPLNRGTGFGL